MRILIVDDESINRFLLAHMLEEAGYTDTYEAESGREAIQLAEKIHPDLVLLDVMMPDTDGFETAPVLKRMAGDIYLPIIFITSLDDQASLARCLEVGGDDFASKPFDKVILTAKIRAHSRTRLLSKKTHAQNQELTYYRNAVEREHAIVEHIFANALAIKSQAKSYFDYRLTPASSFNGDLFLIETSPSGGMYFLLGDFTGHGLASAIGALPVARAFQAMAGKGVSVSEMVRTLNETLLALLPGDMFFAAAVVEVANNGRQLSVWNGGLPDLVVLRSDGDIKKRFESQHMALGILEVDEFDETSEFFEIQHGDRLIGFSDGVIELTNSAQEMLGEEALLNWLKAEPSIPVDELVRKLEAFRGAAEQLDDITLVTYTGQSLDDIPSDHDVTRVPFDIQVKMGVEELKSVDPVHDLVTMVGSQAGMQSVRSDLSLVLSELFNNALDHGILDLDSSIKQTTDGFFEYFEQRMSRLAVLESGQILVRVVFVPTEERLIIEVEDSGKGFDVTKLQDVSENDSFGRGINLVREMCESVHYSDGGTRVTVEMAV